MRVGLVSTLISEERVSVCECVCVGDCESADFCVGGCVCSVSSLYMYVSLFYPCPLLLAGKKTTFKLLHFAVPSALKMSFPRMYLG